MKCYADGCENKNCVYLVLAERFIANQKLKVIENAQINANTVKSITNRWSNKMFANVWWLGEVPPCRMFKFSTTACGGILPNHCYKPAFIRVWLNNLT
jgi:hypothetical protein